MAAVHAVIPMLWALQDVDKTDGHQVRYGFASHNRHSNHEVTAAMHEQLSRPQTSAQKARLSDALNKWRRDARGLEAIGYPTSKEGTFYSLKTFVEGLRAEVHARSHFGSRGAFLLYSTARVGVPALFGSSAELNSRKVLDSFGAWPELVARELCSGRLEKDSFFLWSRNESSSGGGAGWPPERCEASWCADLEHG